MPLEIDQQLARRVQHRCWLRCCGCGFTPTHKSRVKPVRTNRSTSSRVTASTCLFRTTCRSGELSSRRVTRKPTQERLIPEAIDRSRNAEVIAVHVRVIRQSSLLSPALATQCPHARQRVVVHPRPCRGKHLQDLRPVVCGLVNIGGHVCIVAVTSEGRLRMGVCCALLAEAIAIGKAAKGPERSSPMLRARLAPQQHRCTSCPALPSPPVQHDRHLASQDAASCETPMQRKVDHNHVA
eukprot:scaffold111233_cov67-Phaeocystis_antarctica.AAC.4